MLVVFQGFCIMYLQRGKSPLQLNRKNKTDMKTKMSKKDYAAKLRQDWQDVKQSLTQAVINEAEAIAKAHGLNFSATGYAFCKAQMAQAKLTGTPYVDCKTYAGWKKAGFQVAKGQKSFGHGITWIKVENKKNPDDSFLFPKSYALFHNSQVEAI